MSRLEDVPYVPFDPTVRRTQERTGKAGHPRGETAQAAYAFALYCALPPHDRSYQKVLDILVAEGRNSPGSVGLVSRWGSRFNWSDRAKVHDAMLVEKQRERWEVERLHVHEEVAASTAEIYNEVARLLLGRAQSNSLSSDAAVQLLRIAADLRSRSYDELARIEDKKESKGIQITIETRADSGATGVTIDADAKVLSLPIALRDPDEADRPSLRPRIVESDPGAAGVEDTPGTEDE